MSTITSLSFAVSSSWDGSGVDRAREAIAGLKADIKAMSDSKLTLSVELEGLEEAKAKIDEAAAEKRQVTLNVNANTAQAITDIDEAARDRDVTLNVNANAAQAATDIDEAARNRQTEILASASTTQARADIDEAARNRDTSIDVSANTEAARADLDGAASPREVLLDVILTGMESAQAQLDEAARARHAILSVMLDSSVAEAQARMDELARDRHATLTVTGNTTGADSSFSSLTGILTNHWLIVTALTAAFTGLGAAAALVGGALLTALGGGVILAGIAVTEIFKKMQTSMDAATTAAQTQANTANNQLATAYQNVNDVQMQGAQNVASANEAVANAQQNIIDTARTGSDAIKSANEQAVLSNQAFQQSQEAVATAYQDTTRQLESLQLQQAQSGDNIEAARIAVARAQDTVTTGPSSTSKDPGLDQRAAINTLALAQDHLNSVLQDATNTQEDYTTAQQQGVEGNPKVVQAKQNEADAAQKAADAQANVVKAQQTATENNTKAQQSLTDAVTKLGQAQFTANENNQKAQTALTQAQQQAAAAQTALNTAMAKGKTAAYELMSQLNDLVSPLSGSLHSAFVSLEQQLTAMAPSIKGLFVNAAPLVQPFLDSITGGLRESLPGMTQALGNMKDMMPGFVSGLTTLGGAVGRMFGSISNASVSLGKITNDWGETFGVFLDQWGTFIDKTGPAAAKTLQNMGKGMDSFNGGVLDGMTGALNNMSITKPQDKSAIQSTFTGLGTIGKTALPAAGSMARAAGNAIAPAIDSLAKPTGDVMGDVFKGGADVIKSITPGLDTLASTIGKVMENLRPAIPLMTQFFSSMGGTFSEELKILSPVLLALSTIIGDILTGLRPLSGVIAVVATGFALWRSAVMAYTIVQAACNLVMDANPLVLLGLAIVALVGGIIYLATKTQFFQDVWRDLKNWLMDAWNALKAVWDDFVTGLVVTWQRVWGDIKQWAMDVWNFLKTAWNDFLAGVKIVWDTISTTIKGAWEDFWNDIKKFVTGLWDDIKTAWNNAIEGWKIIWDTVSAILKQAWHDFWNDIKTVASDIWDGIKSAFSTFGTDFKKGFQGIVDDVKGIWNGMKKIFADPINFIIDASNNTIGKVISSAHMDHINLAEGGVVPGNGGAKADDVHAMLSSKEFVVNGAATSKNMAVLHHINSGGEAIPKFADGGPVDPSTDMTAINRGLDWAASYNGQDYNAQGWLDCSGIASGIYDEIQGKTPHREFTTVSDFTALGFKTGTGGIMEIGVNPLPGSLGHMAVSIGGHNVESGGAHNNIAVDGPAVGAMDSQFKDHYYLPGSLFSPVYTGAGSDPGASDKSSGGGGFFGMLGSAITSVGNAVKNGMADAFIAATNPILSVIPDPIPGTSQPFGSFPKGDATKGRDALAEFIKGHESTTNADAPFGGTAVPSAEHKALIDQAVTLAGGPAPNTMEQWESGYETLISRESGWNPVAINDWDSNAKAGWPTKGLTQMRDDTFQSHMIAGHGNIWDPLDNISSDVGYIKAEYGGITGVQQANSGMAAHGYATGTNSATPGWALVGELGPELIKMAGGEVVMNNSDLSSTLKSMQKATAADTTTSDSTVLATQPGDTGTGIPGVTVPNDSDNGGSGQTSNLNSTLSTLNTSALQAGKSFATSTVDQFGSDIGLGSITNGSGALSKLLTEGNSYAQKLLAWHQSGESGNGIIQQLKQNQQQAAQPTTVNVSGDGAKDAMQQYLDKQRMQAAGFDGSSQ